MDAFVSTALSVLLLLCGCAYGIWRLWRRTHHRCVRCGSWVPERFAYCPWCAQRQFRYGRGTPETEARQRPRASLDKQPKASGSLTAAAPRKRQQTIVLPEIPQKQKRAQDRVPAPDEATRESPLRTRVNRLCCPRCYALLQGDESGYCGQCGARVTGMKGKK